MKRTKKYTICAKSPPNRSEKGVALIEAAVAIALLGGVALVFIYGIATAFKADLIADEHSAALSLAQSQIEYVKQQDYQNATGTGAVYNSTSTAPGYSIWGVNSANATVANIIGVPWDTASGTATSEAGIQKVTVVIKLDGNNSEILNMTIYKVRR